MLHLNYRYEFIQYIIVRLLLFKNVLQFYSMNMSKLLVLNQQIGEHVDFKAPTGENGD